MNNFLKIKKMRKVKSNNPGRQTVDETLRLKTPRIRHAWQ